jgi:hypothetical protein
MDIAEKVFDVLPGGGEASRLLDAYSNAVTRAAEQVSPPAWRIFRELRPGGQQN